MKMKMALIEADLIAARQAIEYFDAHGIRDIKNIDAYHIQQAAEKLIKIQIYASGAAYDNASMFTHNLEKLILYAESLGIDLNVPTYIRENSLVLTGWEAGSRYEVGFQIRIDSLKKALREAESWFDALYQTGLREA